MTVRHQACDQINRTVAGTALARMRDLQQGLAVVKHRFQQRPPPQDQFVVEQQQAVRQVALEEGDQAKLSCPEHVLGEWRRQVALVGKQAAPPLVRYRWHATAIIGGAGCHVTREQLALVINHHMQLEARQPAHRGFTALRHAAKHALESDPAMVAHWGRG